MSLDYGIGLDTTQMERDAQKANLIFKNIGDNAQSQANRIDLQFRNAFAFAGGAAAASAFVSQLVNVRGEFQQLEIAFTTMLKSKERSDKLMQDVSNFAATTPFDLKQVASGTKQLLAYGFTAEDITKNLSMLGNVASGVGSQIGDIIYLYGTLKASGRVTQMDINQFAGRGIPIYEELAKVLGVTREEVRGFVSEGKVGFSDIEKAFQGMTGESGIFYNLMQEQSKSITGQLSNLGDSVDAMFNKIGQSSQGLISNVIGVAQDIVANYEEVGKIIGGLVATYGAYKAAVMVLTTVQKVNTAMQLEAALAGRALTTAEALQAVVTKQLSVAQALLNKTMLANPYVLVATVVVGLAAAMWALHDSTTEAEKAQKEYNEEKQTAAELEEKHKQEIEKLIEAATNQALSDMERVNALETLKQKYPEIFKQYDIESLKLADILKLKKQIADADSKTKQKQNSDNLVNIDAQIRAYQTKINDLRSGAAGQQAAGLAANYMREIEKLRAKRQLYEQDVEADNVNNFLASVSGISNKQLEYEINIRQQLLAKIGNTNNVGKLNGLGSFNKDELTSQLDALTTENENRHRTLTTGNQDLKKANDDLKLLQKQRSQILTAELPAADREKQLKDIDEQIDAVNKKIKLLGGGTAKDKDKQNKEAQKLAQAKADLELKEKNDTIKSGFDLRQAEIDKQNAVTAAMEDGFAKQKQLIEDDHNQKLLDIDKRAQELIEKQQQSEREAWQKNGSKGTFKPTTTSVDQLDAQNTSLLSTYKQTVEIKYKADTSSFLKSLNDAYLSFDEKRRQIDDKYKSDESVLKSTYSGSTLDTKLKELNNQHKQELQDIDSQEAEHAMKTSQIFIDLFGNMSAKSIKDIRSISNEAQQLFDYLNTTDVKDITPHFGLSTSELLSIKLGKKEMQDISDQIKDLNKQADGMETGFAKIGNAFKKVYEGVSQQKAGKSKVSEGNRNKASGDSNLAALGDKQVAIGTQDQLDGIEKYKDGISTLQTTFQSVMSFGSQAVDLLNAISTEEGDAASAAANSIGAVMDVANSTMQGFQQGGWAGAAVAFAMSVTTKIVESEKAHQEAIKKLQDDKIAQQKEYNDLLIEQNQLLEDSKTIFGTDTYSQSKGYIQQYYQYLSQAKKAINDLSSATVATGSKKTGLFGWGGEKTVYSDLLKTYPDLIDSQGNLNKELAQSILDNQNLKDTSKEALQTALDYTEKYEDALSQLDDYLSNIFGSLGSDLMTAITDNLGDTKSALDDFADYTASTLEKMASDIAYSIYFADIFQNLSDQVKDVMTNSNLTDEQKAQQQLELLGNFFSGLSDETAGANTFLQNFQTMAEQHGFDLWSSDSTRTGSSKGITTASQDTVDELNGRFTVIQGHTFQITESIKILQEDSAQTLIHLARIETNTSRLEAVENGISSIKAGIDTINMKGVKLQ